MACVLVAVFAAGCPIPQEPGRGKTLHLRCRTMDRWYWLYVPENHNSERRYPLVVTLHGMKPYDVSYHHVRMWGRLADKHGYIILAPELQTSDSFGQFPMRKMWPSEQRDVKAILTIMDEVTGDWEIDRSAVFLSSWSMGGYLAHYIATEHGDRFAGFAPLQSNFCNEPLNPANAQRFAKTMPLFIFYGTVDFPGVTGECKTAIEWYRRLGFDVQTKKESIGHQRHPELAAQFFDRIIADPRRPKKLVEIAATPPRPAPAPVAINLWPALSSRVGDVRSYVWDFGRLGGPSYLKSPNVLIRQAGEYPVRLTVTDSAGRKFVADTKLVVPGPPASALRNNGQNVHNTQ